MFTSFPCAVRYLAVSLASEWTGRPTLNIPLSCPSLGRESPPIFSHRHLSSLCLVGESAGFELQSRRRTSSSDIQRPDRGSPRWRCRLRVKTVILSTLVPLPLIHTHDRSSIRFFESIFETFELCRVMIVDFHRVSEVCSVSLIASFGNITYFVITNLRYLS